METAVVKKRTRKIPDALIYDLIDGKPYYRKGYRSVLNKTQTLESIMGCSSLQTLIIHFLLKYLYKNTEDEYYFFTNEPGLHLDRRNNLAGDICIYKSDMPGVVFNHQYLNTPPLMQIEVDVVATLEDEKETTYINKKVNKLLEFGTGKVIWIFTAAESILVATPQSPWQWMNWNNELELLPGLSVNIGKFIASVNTEKQMA